MQEGYIEYEITYMENTLKNIPTELLPRKMLFKFKGDATNQKIDGFLGFFSIFHVVNPKKSINSTFLKVRNFKYYYPGGKRETSVGFDKMEGMKITYQPEMKTLAGYDAQRATISFPDESKEGFDVYFTNEIPLNSPNRPNPYRQIDGVLLEFRLSLNNLDMHLKAREVVYTSIPDKEFIVPDGYKAVSRSEMERVIRILLD